jgi:alpha-1,3-glucosyltransferase
VRFYKIIVVPSPAMAGTPSGRHHKPRRKVKNGEGKGFQLSKAETLVRTPSFPLSAFLWPARASVSQWEVLPLILMVVGLFRWAAGLWGYSGKRWGPKLAFELDPRSVCD